MEMIGSIVSRFRIFEVYEQVYNRYKTDEQRFKAVQEQTGAGIGRIRQTIGDAHEEGQE